MSRFSTVPDYGPEIVPGARVMDLTGRRGIVVTIQDRCHWGCQEWDRSWRPRAAYVEWDGSNGAGYAEPETLARIPSVWPAGEGVISTTRTVGSKRPFQATVVRLRLLSDSDAPRVEHEWHLMNRADKGWGESSYAYPSWSALLRDWSVALGEPYQDEHGLCVPVTPTPVLQ